MNRMLILPEDVAVLLETALPGSRAKAWIEEHAVIVDVRRAPVGIRKAVIDIRARFSSGTDAVVERNRIRVRFKILRIGALPSAISRLLGLVVFRALRKSLKRRGILVEKGRLLLDLRSINVEGRPLSERLEFHRLEIPSCPHACHVEFHLLSRRRSPCR